jgi:putative ABC transport system ATP-binding protein
MPSPILEFQTVRKVYGEGASNVVALDDVSFGVSPGEFVVITGPSGSGKSTLVHLAAGLDTPTRGSVVLAGTDLSTLDDDQLSRLRCHDVTLVFQAFHLVDYMTAEENVALPLRFDGASASDARQRAREALDSVGLSTRAHHRPSELSGGEMQRVALARAVASRPMLILADEPTGNLDSVAGDSVLALLTRIAAQGPAVLVVTHDPHIAASGHRVISLRDGALVSDTAMASPARAAT